MKIAVCDYDSGSAAAIRDMVEHYCALYDLKITPVRCIYSPAELQACGEYFDILYMGFGGGAGFNAARELRDRDKDCRIIMVDHTQEYAIRGLRLHCTDFILRPVEFPHVVKSMKLATGGAL